MSSTVRACLFPTTVVLVHDRSPFMTMLGAALSDKMLVADKGRVDAAIQLIRGWRDRPFKGIWTAKVSADSEVTQSDNYVTLEADLERLRHIARSPRRFGCPSVAVIDWDSCRNSIAVARELAEFSIRKVILSGSGPARTALTAFTAHGINAFISKFDVDFLDILATEIARQQAIYFEQPLACLRPALETHFAFLQDQGFAAWFAGACRKHGIVEHYVSGDPYGLLVVDAEGRPSLLLVASAGDHAEQIDVATQLDADPELIALLKARVILAWFPGSNGYYDPIHADRWRDYVWPAITPEQAPQLRCALVPAVALDPALSRVNGALTAYRKHIPAAFNDAADP